MSEYYQENCCPIKCLKCQSTELEDRILDTLDGHTILEYSIHCSGCGTMVGYWAYGYFDPSFNPDWEKQHGN